MGSHGTPAHWKSMKQICIEQKTHMDFLPVPEGSWHEHFNKQQRKGNLMLLASVAAVGITYFIVSIIKLFIKFGMQKSLKL